MSDSFQAPLEASNIIRRSRTPESFLFGPILPYGTLTVSASGQYVFVQNSSGRGVLSDNYCNAMIVTFANTGSGGAVADSLGIRVATRRDTTSPVASDLIILTSQSAGAVLVVPMFCAMFSVTAFIVNAAGTTYPTNVGWATSIIFC